MGIDVDQIALEAALKFQRTGFGMSGQRLAQLQIIIIEAINTAHPGYTRTSTHQIGSGLFAGFVAVPRSFLENIRDNDFQEPISDAGHTVIDGLKEDARRFLRR